MIMCFELFSGWGAVGVHAQQYSGYTPGSVLWDNFHWCWGLRVGETIRGARN